MSQSQAPTLIARRFEWLAQSATEAVARAAGGEPWEAFREFVEGAAAMQAGDRALSEAMASRSERMAAAAESSGLIVELERLLRLAKRAGELRKDLAVEDIPAMVCSVSSVAVAAAARHPISPFAPSRMPTFSSVTSTSSSG